MTRDEVKLKARSLLRRAGLAQTPKPVLACLIAVSILLLGFALWRFWPAGPASVGEDFSVEIAEKPQGESQDLPDSVKDSDNDETYLSIDVEGAVRAPGLYELPMGSRIGDAVEAAGGMTKHAQRGAVNLAQQLQDGQQVVVPKKGADAVDDSEAVGSLNISSRSSSASAGSSSEDKININTATADQLQELDGIGESLSQRIVDYRQANGSFASVDDLANVSGIGDARLAAIRDRVCV